MLSLVFASFEGKHFTEEEANADPQHDDKEIESSLQICKSER